MLQKYNFIFELANFTSHSPRWRKLAACAQFKIQNSKFPTRPTRLTSPTCPTNSKFKILLSEG